MRFRVEDWVAFGPGLGAHPELTEWSSGMGTARRATELEEVNLPPMFRRRISSAGQTAFRAASALGEQEVARFVFCSRYGELDRTFRILNSIVTAEPISPADFTLSVHNALAGLLSIGWRNTAGHTAVCAGADTFGFGLLEAVASLNDADAGAVMLIYFEDSVPPPYDELVEKPESRVALSMLLKPPRNERGEFRLAFAPRSQVNRSMLATAQSMDFIKFMLSDDLEREFVGDRAQWRWQRCA
jgi:Beta-ketoacyl synthase, N-terminal domain